MNCNICPRKCDIDREVNRGFCRSGVLPKINIYQLHYGEEPVISGTRGSGTIFFSGCNLSCVYCQNYQISQLNYGKEYCIKELAEIMIELQAQGAHNINLVTPTHFSLQIKEGLIQAKAEGLKIPVVWNSNAYEEVETLKKLEGLVDIYLPDFKYFNNNHSKKYSGARDYPEKAKSAIKEMYRQAGNIKTINRIALRGVLIRLLVLPHNLNEIEKILEWLYTEFGAKIHLSLMGQYYPTYKATKYKELDRGINRNEYSFALNQLRKYGFSNGYIQELSCNSDWTPDFRTD
ncbi:MAG: radical SAM protein [Bacteroidales bacterium]|nr:radical SAM protein [Bacteroidales bacterium]